LKFAGHFSPFAYPFPALVTFVFPPNVLRRALKNSQLSFLFSVFGFLFEFLTVFSIQIGPFAPCPPFLLPKIPIGHF